jgi:hypothetical protein
MNLEPGDRRRIYEFMRAQGCSRLTIKILMGYLPDGMDRLTVILGKGTEYDYRLIKNEEYRSSELRRILEKAKTFRG